MKKTVSIALIMPLGEDYWRGILQGIAKYAGNNRPWLLSYFDPADAKSAKSFAPEGIIAAIDSAELAEMFQSGPVPCVNISSAMESGDSPHVVPDDAGIGLLAAVHFLQRGMKHFAFVGLANRADSAARQGGFATRLGREEVPKIDVHLIGSGSPAQEQSALAQWLAELPKPCGVLGLNDRIARQVIDACRDNSLRVPRDIAVLGVGDDLVTCNLATPRISSVSLPSERVGFEAAALLEKFLAGRRRGIESSVLPVSSVIGRGSTDVVSIEDPQVAAAVRFIMAHAGEWIGVRELLMSMPIQRRSLERKFRAVLGRSPLEEIRRVRLEIARELLATTDLPMPLVARRAGFSEAKQLSTVFRAEVGMTPTEYRARFRVVVPVGAESESAGGGDGAAGE